MDEVVSTSTVSVATSPVQSLAPNAMVWLLTEPWMDPLRGERQYRELLDYIGLATGKAGPKP